MFKKFPLSFALSALAGLCCALYSAALAENGEVSKAAPSGNTDSSRPASAPAPLPPRPLNLPEPLRYKLPNGLDVILLEDHRVPFVTFQLGIKAGDKNDPANLTGLATLTAEMLTEGTKTRDSKAIAEQLDSNGAAMKGSAEADFTVVSGSVLSDQLKSTFTILGDIVRNPVFPEAELKLNKTNLIQALEMKRSDPDFLGSERFSKVVFGKHPYAVISPSKDSIERISRDELIKFHAAHYLPNLSTLVVVGDFNTPQMKELITDQFGSWQRGQVTPLVTSPPPHIQSTRIYLIDRPGSVQSTVKIGNLGISKLDPDYFATQVANQVLGGSANSRLFLNIREQKGYTYGAYSGFAARQEPGEFTASAAVRTPVTAPSLLEFLYELNRIRTLPVSATELESAKKYLIGNFQLGFETQGGVAARLLDQAMYNLPADYLRTWTDKVAAVKPEDLRRVAHKYIDYPNLVITIVGDAKQIEPELRYFYPVDVYDVTGKPRVTPSAKNSQNKKRLQT